MENNQIAICAGLFLLVTIGLFLIIPMSEERTLILTTPSNSTGGCSDLDCLNDVTLIDLINNQILVFNSTSGDWENTNQTSFVDTTVCNNLGNGKIICPSYSSGNINLRTLKASTGLSIANDTTSITYTNTLPESTVCSGQSGNYNIVASSSGGNCTFKNLVPSTGISMSTNSTHIIITNSKPEQGCSSAGGTSIWKTTTTCDAKGLTAGVGLTLTSNTNDNNYKTNFANGTGITITGTTTQTFASKCNSTGSGEAICESSNNINSLIATSPLSVSDTTGDLTIDCSTCFILLDNSSPSDGATTWTSGTFTAKKYLVLEIYVKGDATTVTAGNLAMQFNGDTGSNYNYYVYVAGSRTASASQSSMRICNIDENYPWYGHSEILNPSGTFKKGGHIDFTDLDGVNLAGGQECESYITWNNTSNQITSITLLRTSGTWAFDSTSFMVVYGHD